MNIASYTAKIQKTLEMQFVMIGKYRIAPKLQCLFDACLKIIIKWQCFCLGNASMQSLRSRLQNDSHVKDSRSHWHPSSVCMWKRVQTHPFLSCPMILLAPHRSNLSVLTNAHDLEGNLWRKVRRQSQRRSESTQTFGQAESSNDDVKRRLEQLASVYQRDEYHSVHYSSKYILHTE